MAYTERRPLIPVDFIPNELSKGDEISHLCVIQLPQFICLCLQQPCFGYRVPRSTAGSSQRSGNAHFLVQSLRHFGTWGIFSAFLGHIVSLLLCGRPVVVCRCVYMYGCLHEFVRACMYMYVCVLVSGTVGDILFWLLWKDDEWHFALQLFLNLKFPF